MNLWTKEIIAENLRDLPAGVREVRSRTAAPSSALAGEQRPKPCGEVRSATGLRCA